jgi:hypothetical protein
MPPETIERESIMSEAVVEPGGTHCHLCGRPLSDFVRLSWRRSLVGVGRALAVAWARR